MGLACHGRPSFDGSGVRGCPPLVSLGWLSVAPSLKPLLCQGLQRRWGASSSRGDTRAEHGSGSRGNAVRCRASLGQQGCSCLSPTAQAGESRPQQRVTRESSEVSTAWDTQKRGATPNTSESTEVESREAVSSQLKQKPHCTLCWVSPHRGEMLARACRLCCVPLCHRVSEHHALPHPAAGDTAWCSLPILHSS